MVNIENYWAQLIAFVASLSWLLQITFSFILKRREFIFVKIKENKIIECKRLIELFVPLKWELHSLYYSIANGSDLSKHREAIRSSMLKIEIQTSILKMFLTKSDHLLLDQLNKLINDCRSSIFIIDRKVNDPKKVNLDMKTWDEAEEKITKELPLFFDNITKRFEIN
ncbi:MAG: hypothetical protein IPN88_08995 [Bacteroidetes bacterium]|nr:hypothetical protein [Bacteroidota bacterium]